MSFEEAATLTRPLERWAEEKRQKLSNCSAFYNNDKVEQSYLELASLRSDCDAGEWGEVVDQNRWLTSVERDWNGLCGILEILGCHEGWTEIENSRGIRGLYRKEADSPMHSIKVHAEVSAPVEHLLALVNEVDLLGSLLRFVKLEARPLAQLSRFSQLSYFCLGLFWPFEDRDFVVKARGVDLLHRDSLAIVGTSCGSQAGPPEDWPDAFPSTPYPERPRGVTRISSSLCGGLIRIVNGHKLVVSVVMNVDPLIAFLPASLINFFTRSLACAGFNMCRKQLASFMGSEYERRVADKRWFYGELAGRIAEHAAARTAARGMGSGDAEPAFNALASDGEGGASALPAALHLPSGLVVAAEQFGLLPSVFWCATGLAATQLALDSPHPLTARLGDVLWAGPVVLAAPAGASLAVVARRGLALLPVASMPRMAAFLASARAARAAGSSLLSLAPSPVAGSPPLFRLRGATAGDPASSLSVEHILNEVEHALSTNVALFLSVTGAAGTMPPDASAASKAPEPAGAGTREGAAGASNDASAESRSLGTLSVGADAVAPGPSAVALRGDWSAPALVAALAAVGCAPHPARLADIARGSDGRPLDLGGSNKTVVLIAVAGGPLHDQLSQAACAAGIDLRWKPFHGSQTGASPPTHALQQCVLVCESGGDASALQWSLASLFC